MGGDLIGLAWHKVEVGPQVAERAVGHDRANTPHLGLVDFHAEIKTLVHHRHICHKIIVGQFVQFLAGVGHIDYVERVREVVAHAAVNPEGILRRLQILGIEIWTERGNTIDGSLGRLSDIVRLPNDGVDIAQLRILQVLGGKEPHLLCVLRADGERGVALPAFGEHIDGKLLCAARHDVQNLIGGWFVVHKVIINRLEFLGITVEVRNALAGLDDSRIRVLND